MSLTSGSARAWGATPLGYSPTEVRSIDMTSRKLPFNRVARTPWGDWRAASRPSSGCVSWGAPSFRQMWSSILDQLRGRYRRAAARQSADLVLEVFFRTAVARSLHSPQASLPSSRRSGSRVTATTQINVGGIIVAFRFVSFSVCSASRRVHSKGEVIYGQVSLECDA